MKKRMRKKKETETENQKKTNRSQSKPQKSQSIPVPALRVLHAQCPVVLLVSLSQPRTPARFLTNQDKEDEKTKKNQRR